MGREKKVDGHQAEGSETEARDGGAGGGNLRALGIETKDA